MTHPINMIRDTSKYAFDPFKRHTKVSFILHTINSWDVVVDLI